MKKEDIRKIIEASNIYEIAANKYNLHLIKSGSSFKCLSPFSNEQTPSCFIDPIKGFFKCFSSGESGDVLDFVRAVEKMDFMEGMRELAAFAGVEIVDEVTEETKHRDKLYNACQELAMKFKANFEQLPEKDRTRFTPELIEKFNLGYHEPSINVRMAKEIGMVSEKGYLITTGRLIFPVRTVGGTFTSFMGRKLLDDTNEKAAKYMNGYDSEIFSKGNTLYGLYEARANIIRNGWGVLTEGNPDAIASHLHLGNAVCSMGTSLTSNQVKMLARYTNKWVIFYDPDSAGIKATVSAAQEFFSLGLNPRIFKTDIGDPFDYYSKVDNQFDYYECQDFFEWYVEKFGKETPELKTLVNMYIGGIESDFDRELASKRFVKLFGIGFTAPQRAKHALPIDTEFNNYEEMLVEIWKQSVENAA